MISWIWRERCRIAQGAALIALTCHGMPAKATENGGSSYAVGVETNLAGLMVSEGLHTFVYYQNYRASHNKDNAGEDNARLADYKTTVNTVALRFSYVWPGARMLGASIETRLGVPIPSVDLSLGIARPAPLTPLDRSGKKTGVADLNFSPILLGWHDGALHQTAGAEFILPTGRFDKEAPVNIGRNYWGFAPLYAITWLPENKWQLSAKVRYQMNSTNRATDYTSGDELTLEYSAGFVVNPTLALGINGFVYRQMSDDRKQGSSVNGDGNRGRVRAIGPYMSVNVTPRFAVMAKLQKEYGARNRPEGTRLWLQTKIPF